MSFWRIGCMLRLQGFVPARGNVPQRWESWLPARWLQPACPQLCSSRTSPFTWVRLILQLRCLGSISKRTSCWQPSSSLPPFWPPLCVSCWRWIPSIYLWDEFVVGLGHRATGGEEGTGKERKGQPGLAEQHCPLQLHLALWTLNAPMLRKTGNLQVAPYCWSFFCVPGIIVTNRAVSLIGVLPIIRDQSQCKQCLTEDCRTYQGILCLNSKSSRLSMDQSLMWSTSNLTCMTFALKQTALKKYPEQRLGK